mmetsp:Transcript_18082/g.59055  ORF Transcript_18082/g.59055 Transcript_18082/m.59055 type:complete len:219 (-) Transcript_18082:429-1085(-)
MSSSTFPSATASSPPSIAHVALTSELLLVMRRNSNVTASPSSSMRSSARLFSSRLRTNFQHQSATAGLELPRSRTRGLERLRVPTHTSFLVLLLTPWVTTPAKRLCRRVTHRHRLSPTTGPPHGETLSASASPSFSTKLQHGATCSNASQFHRSLSKLKNYGNILPAKTASRLTPSSPPCVTSSAHFASPATPSDVPAARFGASASARPLAKPASRSI